MDYFDDRPGMRLLKGGKPTQREEEMTKELEKMRAKCLRATVRLDEVRTTYKKMLEDMKNIHERNERASRDIRAIRHSLIQARSLEELLGVLFSEFERREVHQFSVCLTTETKETLAGKIDELPEETREKITSVTECELSDFLNVSGKIAPRLGLRRDVDKFGFFGPEIRSCMIAPLKYRDNLIGCLNMGSRSKDRYAEDRAPDLLEDLAVTVALNMDNVITHERNEQLATTDPLTGIYNRRYFFEYAARTIDLSNRYGDSVSCIYIDLNDFKPINDNYGHDAGDLALKKMVSCIMSRIRRTDVFARLGGDEFAVLLPRINMEEAGILAENLRLAVSEISFKEEGYPDMRLSASFGLASTRPQDSNLEDMINRADEAMYEDKKASKKARS